VKTQEELVLQLLKERGDRGLTPMDALLPPERGGAGCFRLAAVIHRLKPQLAGDPRKEIINLGYTTASGKHVARYVLRERVQGPHEPVQPSLW